MALASHRLLQSTPHLLRHPPRPLLSTLTNVPPSSRPTVFQKAQQALADYLHSTKSIEPHAADQISKHSLHSLSKLIRKVNFVSPSAFPQSFSKFLMYHHIDELHFFYESIGIDPALSNSKPGQFGFKGFSLACLLSGYGFPWSRLGELCLGLGVGIFDKEPKEVMDRIFCLEKKWGFKNVALVEICLAFPQLLLRLESDLTDFSDLLNDLQRGNDLADSDWNVKFWCGIIKLLYGAGFRAGEVGDLLIKYAGVFKDYSEEVLCNKFEYFCRLGVEKKDVFMLLLEKPEILCFDLEMPLISLSGFLKHIGLSEDVLESSVARNFPYVLGRNRMANLPGVMRALNLHEWFFDWLKTGRHELLGSYVMEDPSEDLDKLYKDGLEKIHSSSTPVHTLGKLKFLHELGFGENRATMKLLSDMRGTETELRERFDCYMEFGADYSILCNSISRFPKMVNFDQERIKEKLGFLLNEMGLSMSSLYKCPQYIEFDLDNRIRPRYRFHEWLVEKGLTKRAFSLTTKIVFSEKKFLAQVSSIHPAAPKHYLERFALRKPSIVT